MILLAASYTFYGLLALLLSGGLFFLLGLLLGWFLWKNHKAQALAIDAKNLEIEHEVQSHERKLNELRAG